MGCPRRRRTEFSPTFGPHQVRTAGGKWAHALCLTLAHDQLIPPRGTGDPLPVCRPVDFERMAKRKRADRIGDYSEIAILAASRARSRGDLGEPRRHLAAGATSATIRAASPSRARTRIAQRTCIRAASCTWRAPRRSRVATRCVRRATKTTARRRLRHTANCMRSEGRRQARRDATVSAVAGLGSSGPRPAAGYVRRTGIRCM